MKLTIWNNCYDSSWKGLITDASFAHPAKFARGLIERINAMLVTEAVENGLFGEERTKRQRKSFFRRLYEAKLPEQDERRIDHEEVLICRRP